MTTLAWDMASIHQIVNKELSVDFKTVKQIHEINEIEILVIWILKLENIEEDTRTAWSSTDTCNLSIPSRRSHLQHVEEQRSELGPLHHEQRHLVTELGSCGGKAPVRHGLGVDRVDHLSQGLLGPRRTLCLLHEGGQLLLHPAAVAPHAVEKVHQPVHALWAAARRVLMCLFLRREMGQDTHGGWLLIVPYSISS